MTRKQVNGKVSMALKPLTLTVSSSWRLTRRFLILRFWANLNDTVKRETRSVVICSRYWVVFVLQDSCSGAFDS